MIGYREQLLEIGPAERTERGWWQSYNQGGPAARAAGT